MYSSNKPPTPKKTLNNSINHTSPHPHKTHNHSNPTPKKQSKEMYRYKQDRKVKHIENSVYESPTIEAVIRPESFEGT
jgi:hypothetical protein